MIKIDDKEIRNPIEQIKKNMDDIEWLKDNLYTTYHYNGILDVASTTCSRANTDLPTGKVNKCWLLDSVCKLFKVTGGDTNTLLISYYCTVKGNAGTNGTNVFTAEANLDPVPGELTAISTALINHGSKTISKYDVLICYNGQYGYVNSSGQITTYVITVGSLKGPKGENGENGLNGNSMYALHEEHLAPIGSSTVVGSGDIDYDRDPQVNDLVMSSEASSEGLYGIVTAVEKVTGEEEYFNITVLTLGDLTGPEGEKGDTGLAGRNILYCGTTVNRTENYEGVVQKTYIDTYLATGVTVNVGDLFVNIEGILCQIMSIQTNYYGYKTLKRISGDKIFYTDLTLSSTIGNSTNIPWDHIMDGTGSTRSYWNTFKDSLIIDSNGMLGQATDTYTANDTIAGLKFKSIVLLKGPAGQDGADGQDGNNGRSIWYLNEALSTTIGGTITLSATYLPDALTGDMVIGNNGYLGTLVDNGATVTITTKESIIGPEGQQGPAGADGQDGLTTDIYVNGQTYTQVGGTITLPDYPTLPTYSISNVVTDQSDVLGIQVTDGSVTYNVNNVEANPTLAGTESDLTSIDIGGTYYKVPTLPTLATVATTGDYDDLINKPDLSNFVTSTDLQTELQNYVESSDLATVATSGEYSDLIGTPTLATVATTGDYDDLIDKPDLSVYELVADAFSGDYNDLTNKPTIPTDVVVIELAENASGTLSASELTQVTTDPTKTMLHRGTVYYALTGIGTTNIRFTSSNGFTSGATWYTVLVNKNNGNWTYEAKTQNYISMSDFATVATTGDYDDLTNKPTIPAAQIQSDWSQSDNTQVDYIKNKPTIPAAQVNSDWNSISGVSKILNKPTIPADFTIITLSNTSGNLTTEQKNLIVANPEKVIFSYDNDLYWLSFLNTSTNVYLYTNSSYTVTNNSVGLSKIILGIGENIKTYNVYKNLTYVATTSQIPVDLTIIEVSGGSGTLSADDLAKITAHPEKVMILRSNSYYVLSSYDNTTYKYCTARNTTSAIQAFTISITGSTGAWSYSYKTSISSADIDAATKYKNGDTFITQTYFNIMGYITSGRKEIALTITVPKSLTNVTSITVDKCRCLFRGVAGYVGGSSYIDYASTTGYTVTATKAEDNTITLQIVGTNAFSDATNNTVVNAAFGNTVGDLSLTFNVA